MSIAPPLAAATELGRIHQVATQEPDPGDIAWRIEFDLLDGRIHALTRLSGRPFALGHVLQPFPGRCLVDIWGPDDEDAIRRHVRAQREKILRGTGGVDRGRDAERAVAADTQCDCCGLLGAHMLVCPRYGR